MSLSWKRWGFAALGALMLVIQAISAIKRGGRGQSDLSVFYRTAVLLSHGADGTVYAAKDAVNGWYRCIPPAGLMWFAPLTSLSGKGASIAWIVFNLLLAGVGAWLLRAILSELERTGDSKAPVLLPIAIGLFFLMAAPSVQVGQFSLMFVVLWMAGLWMGIKRKIEGAALVLALPAAIKIYPALLVLVPLGALRVPKWPRFAITFALGCAFWTWGVPFLFYGARTASLQSGFWHEVVLSPSGRLSESQTLDSSANHGLDAVLLRFASSLPEPAGAPPHLNFAPGEVLHWVNPLRALFLLLTVGVWFWSRRNHPSDEGVRSWIDAGALWSAALFLLLPGAKSRYAVYAFLAFLPLLLHAIALFRTQSPKRWPYAVLITVVTLLVLSFVPPVGRLWGAGFWGALVLWAENARLLLAPRLENTSQTASAEQRGEVAAMLRAS